MFGLSDDEITAIREGRLDGFAPPEAALLRMADAMADTPSNVSDELYTELRRHFSEEQLINSPRPRRKKTFAPVTTASSMWEVTGSIERGSDSKSGASPSDNYSVRRISTSSMLAARRAGMNPACAAAAARTATAIAMLTESHGRTPTGCPTVSKNLSLGFSYVTLDLEGFRSGSMNAILPVGNIAQIHGFVAAKLQVRAQPLAAGS
jgi:hypothetical protein